jgi:hypothetical protein
LGVNDADKVVWRAELKRRGLESVKFKLMVAGVGRGAALVGGFESPSEIPRNFVEEWVAVEEQKARQRHRTLIWTIVGGVAGIVSIIAGIVVAILEP